jgi:type II secretory pathway component GspD/PulD (secretin)
LPGASPAAGANPPTTGFALGNPGNNNIFGSFGHLVGGFAILSVPQMSATLRFLNEDADAEFLANPRVVTADNQKATIEITRNQPVPQLNFNEQTATAVFGGFQDKVFGNKLMVRPSVNKDSFITLNVQPEISNKVADQPFVFAGATVTSPIIDTRKLDSNVLIKSGDTLAIGGLLQDETTKARNKVPLMGDIPLLGYFFQEHLNVRTKRNLLVFVTPTIIDQHYGTGLEDQVSGLHDSGEEFADPNGWRNNARGAVRLVPTANRQVVTDYPVPGIAPAPDRMRYMSTATERDQ